MRGKIKDNTYGQKNLKQRSKSDCWLESRQVKKAKAIWKWIHRGRSKIKRKFFFIQE